MGLIVQDHAVVGQGAQRCLSVCLAIGQWVPTIPLDPLLSMPGPDARVACETGQGLTAAAISSRHPVPLVTWPHFRVTMF